MIRKLLFILNLVLFITGANSQTYNWKVGNKNIQKAYRGSQLIFDNTLVTWQTYADSIILYAGVDQGFSTISSSTGEGGVYKDTGGTMEATASGDTVNFWKGFGNDLFGNTPNLVTFDNDPKDRVWFANEAENSDLAQVIDRGNGYRYVRIHNGPGMRWDTGPGQINPAMVDPVDIIQVHRIMPNPNQEVDGFLKYVSQTSNWELAFGSSFETTNVSNGLYNLTYTRVTVDASGNWELRFDDLDKAVPDASGTGYTISRTEQTIGSNGHPQESQIFCKLYNFNVGGFTQSELDILQRNFEQLWPLGKPDYPYDDGGFISGSNFNTTTNVWTSPKGTFGGGSGTEGTYDYQWYYFNENNTTTFPLGNKLDEHDSVKVPSGSTRFLDRDEMFADGTYYTDGATQGGGEIWLMCVRTPRDDQGVVGEKIQSSWVVDDQAGNPSTPNPQAPTDISLSSMSIDENTTGLVGIISDNGEPTSTYTITGGADASDFNILSDNELHLITAKDYESVTSLAVTLTATNTQGSFQEAFTISINDIPEGYSQEIIMNFGNLTVDATRTTVDGLKIIQDVDYNTGDADMVDIDGNATGIGVSWSSWGGTSGNGVNTDGDNIPGVVWRDYVFMAGTATMTFSGFNPNEVIGQIWFSGSRSGSGTPRITEVTIGIETKSYNALGNNQLTSVDGNANGAVYFNDVSADASGNLLVTFTAETVISDPDFVYNNVGGILRY